MTKRLKVSPIEVGSAFSARHDMVDVLGVVRASGDGTKWIGG